MKKAVRQMRGPGMNKGLKKPRHGKFSGTSKSPSAGGNSSARRNDYKKGSAGSYLSPDLGGSQWGRN